MNIITNITNMPNQTLGLILDNKSKAVLSLKYNARLQSWYMDLTYNTFTLYNRRVFTSPNMIRQWDKVLPFGIACYATDVSEPYYITDFSNGRCVLMLLNATDIEAYESYLSGLKDA